MLGLAYFVSQMSKMQATIITPTPRLEASKLFFSTLGFQQFSENPLIYSDGKAYIEINPDRYTRAGIKLYKSSWKEEVEKLERLTLVKRTKEGYLLSESSGTWIYLHEGTLSTALPQSEQSFSVLGNSMGISLECMDAEKSYEIFEILGFKPIMGSLDSGFVVLANGDFAVSLMKPLTCPHLFFSPSLNYFNGKENLQVIQKIRDLKIPITEEITYFNKQGIVDNVIIRDPGGLGFFIFSD